MKDGHGQNQSKFSAEKIGREHHDDPRRHGGERRSEHGGSHVHERASRPFLLGNDARRERVGVAEVQYEIAAYPYQQREEHGFEQAQRPAESDKARGRRGEDVRYRDGREQHDGHRSGGQEYHGGGAGQGDRRRRVRGHPHVMEGVVEPRVEGGLEEAAGSRGGVGLLVFGPGLDGVPILRLLREGRPKRRVGSSSNGENLHRFAVVNNSTIIARRLVESNHARVEHI
mmetsp:Transcript_10283/g.22245  ORF Transcript_10283/g.22245 Transcript_10283/m.22245 type:complete len:228 (-) Transcript_10283:421-1104(-)